jgi:TonB-linked SusC/RagA family outer membrane protein
MQVSAAGFAQKISMSKKNGSLKTVLRELRSQSGYNFVYTKAQMDNARPVSIDVKNTQFEDVLSQIFDAQPLTYSIDNKTIILIDKEKSFIDKLTARFQAIDVSGRVVDENGAPLIGATVSVKGAGESTTTNAKGEFSFAKLDEEAVLQISFMGYLTKEVSANSDLSEIKMVISNSKLDEVQVMGYGVTNRRLSTATIGVLKADDIAKQPVNDPLQALQGRIAGVIVTPTTGNFGGKLNIEIRGKNSLNFQSNPLFIVDDVPIDNENFKLNNTIADVGTGNLSPFSYLNPNDIESITILKDADATAIYGSRGANGVILITTKKGKVGRTNINLNSQIGYSEVAKKITLLNTQQYIEMRKEAYKNDGLDFNKGTVSSSNADLRLYDPNSYTDWQDIMIGGKAQFQDYQGHISGGTNSMQYIIGGNLHRETTVYPGENSNKKGNVHFSLGGNLFNNKLKFAFTANYLIDNMNTGFADYTQNIFLAPNAPALLNADGSINWALNPTDGRSTWTYKGNPYANDLIRNDSKVNNMITSLNIGYEIIKDLKLKIVGGYNKLSGSNVYTRPITASQPFSRTSSIPPRSSGFATNTTESWSVEPQLTYMFSQGKNNLSVLAGASIQNNFSESDYLFLRGFSSDALLLNRAAAPIIDTKENTNAQYKYAAVFARATYKWDDKYIINLNARRDGSSRFGPGHQFGNFGSVGTAWIFSEENFIQEHFPILSFGKMKFSYGITGNDGIGNYAYMESYRLTQSTIAYQNDLGYTSNGAINANYHWETVKKMEFGIELGILKDRILVQANYFRNRSNNQLINYPLPDLAGYGEVFVNLPANLQNTGLELTLNTINVKSNNFSWNTDLTFTRNRNKLLKYTDIDQSAYYLSQIGQPFYGYANTYRFAGVDPNTGQYQFFDTDNNVSATPVNTGPPYYGFDGRIITYPKFYGGISNNLNYKNVSLDFFFQFTKQMGLNPIYNSIATPGNPRTNQLEDVNSRWRNVGDQTQLMKFTTGSSLAALYTRTSNVGYIDASFIRLKNVSLSYNLPIKLVQKYGFQKCRLNLQGQNLYTFTNYKGLDPETQSLTSLPPLRVWTMGLQLVL